MITDMTFNDFWKANEEAARKIAINQLGEIKGKWINWDRRIDESSICEESIINAMQKVYYGYTAGRGNFYGFLKTVIHNEMSDLINVEMAHFDKLGDIGVREEADYSWEEMTDQIHDSYMDDLKSRLRTAIGMLPPMDQAILNFYITDPKTYVEMAAEELGIKANLVSVRKNRALEKIPALMGMATPVRRTERPASGFMGFMTLTAAKPQQVNFVYPEFNLEATVNRIANKILMIKGEI